MIRKHERIIATLLIWIAELIAIAFVLDRLTGVRVQMENAWYYSGSVVTGATFQEATQVMEELQSVTGSLFMHARTIAQAELMPYAPYILLICAILLIGGVLSTLFVWRSVIVPDRLKEMLNTIENDEDLQSSAQSLASLLEDDGEVAESADTSHPALHPHREAKS